MISETIGHNGVGIFSQSGGLNLVGALYTALGSFGFPSTYNLTGGTLQFSAGEDFGAGVVNQSGGLNESGPGFLNVAGTAGFGTTGQYNLSGTGAISVGSEFIENAGSFNQPAGTNTIAGTSTLFVAFTTSAPPQTMPTYTLSGTGVLTAGTELVGQAGSAAFIQTGGTNTTTSALGLVLGGSDTYRAGSSIVTALGTGTYTLSGTGTLVSPFENIGYTGTGVFVQTGGLNLSIGTASTVILGTQAGATGSYLMQGGTLSSVHIYVGHTGAGTFTQTGGSVTASTFLLAAGAGEFIGYSGTGSFVQTGGVNVISTRDLVLGFNSSANFHAQGFYSLSGGVLQDQASGGLFLGFMGSGNYAQSGGTATIAGPVTAGDGLSATFNLSGGTFNCDDFTLIQNSSVNLTISNNAVLNFTGALTIANSKFISASITGGSVTFASVSLSGALTQTGGTAVYNHINGNGALSIQGGLTHLNLNGGANSLGSLTLSPATGATLDISNNNLLIGYASPANDPIAAITTDLHSGYNNGAWTGAGLDSSAAATSGGLFTLAAIDGNNPADATAAANNNVGPNQLLIKFASYGDVNFTGAVDFFDLLAIAPFYGQPGVDWTQGDFNFDGTFNFPDLLLLARDYSPSLTTNQIAQLPSNFVTDFQSAQTEAALPEPLGLAPLAAASLLLIARKPRKQKPAGP